MTLIAGSWPTEPYSPISFQPTILLLHQFVAFATTGTSSPDPEAFGEWAIFAKRTLPLFQSKMGAVLIDDWDVSKFYTNKICVVFTLPLFIMWTSCRQHLHVAYIWTQGQ